MALSTDLPLAVAASTLGTTADAFYHMLLRHRGSPAAKAVRFDGLCFRKTRRNVWLVRLGAPWREQGLLRPWLSTPVAAARMGISDGTLRKQLWRRSKAEAGGVQVARLDGFVACKLSGVWKVCLGGGGLGDG